MFSHALLLTHFPILVPILIPKDLLNPIILSYQSLSNLSYSCCTLILPKNPAKKILLSFDLLYSSANLSIGQCEYGSGQHFYTGIKLFLFWKSPAWDVQMIKLWPKNS